MTASRLRRRLPRPGDDRGSMPMLLMVMIVGMVLGALLVPMIITQDRTTRFDTTRVQALGAAQAGLDSAVGQIRAAVDDEGIGNSAALPCGPISGAVNGVGAAAYTVSIEYFTADPTTNPATPTMTCSAGHGTYDGSTGVLTPSYARLTSTGTDGPAVNGATTGRTLVSTYVFKTSNTNISGGVIRIFPSDSSTTEFCMDAGSATPAVSTIVTLDVCSNTMPPIAQQVFAYRTDLTLQLLSSITATVPNGLCLDTAKPATAGNTIVLNACTALGSPTYSQQWSFNDNGAFQAALSTTRTSGTLASVCMNVASQVVTQQVNLATCAGGTSNPAQAFIPAPSVGAGAAAAPQLVNYQQFGRCLDVTNQQVSSDHLIAYPCKQNPNAGAVAWNQKFASNVSPGTVGQLYTTTGGTNYCLTSPNTIGGWVVVKPCTTTGADAPKQKWIAYDGDHSLSYSKEYTVTDSSSTPLCLGLTPGSTPTTWYTIDVESCDGSTEQKWNADPNLSVSTMRNTLER